ncbi:uncharacterized protein LOC136086838 [Hydra vulgaris]|uniref:Uncharacterized protein LOC136086838 n=1 Tax=Hydra vulgaris TaxID=6087 RepID=A0ABM4CU21_HYDVU
MLKTLGVELYSTENEEKSCVVERWNRTLKDKMFKYFSANSTRKYNGVLDEMVNKYNNTKHSSIKMTPVEASDKKMNRYTPRWTEEVFTVSKIQFTDPPTYKLTDDNGEEIQAKYMQKRRKCLTTTSNQEVQKILVDFDQIIETSDTDDTDSDIDSEDDILTDTLREIIN